MRITITLDKITQKWITENSEQLFAKAETRDEYQAATIVAIVEAEMHKKRAREHAKLEKEILLESPKSPTMESTNTVEPSTTSSKKSTKSTT